MEAALSLRTEQALDKAKDLKAQLNKYIIDFKSISKGQIHHTNLSNLITQCC